MKGNETPTYITTAALSDIYSPFLSFIESGSRAAAPRRASTRRSLPGSSCEPHSAAYIGILLLMAKHNLEESCRTLAGKMLRWREVKKFASLSRFLPQPGYLQHFTAFFESGSASPCSANLAKFLRPLGNFPPVNLSNTA